MASNPNPLQGWAGASGVNQPSTAPFPTSTTPLPTPFTGQGSQKPGTATNPYGFGAYGGGAIRGNVNEANLQKALMGNALTPQFAQMMFGAGGQAGNLFQNYMNLGSPYYQQAQRSVWEQGTQQANNAAALARQQLSSQGYGYTPSGAEAAMIGGMGTGTAGSLAQNYLQQLFNNQQLQMNAGQSMSQLASLFNPAQFTGQPVSFVNDPNSLAANLGAVGSLMGGMFGQYGMSGKQ